jgi:hypothetical protein
MYGRRLANFLIGILSLWAIYAILASAFGIPVVFPLTSGDENGVPMWRLLVVRHAVLGSFAFYGIMHLLQGSKEVYPVHFLKTFLFFLGLMGIFFAVGDHFDGTGVQWTDWAIIIFLYLGSGGAAFCVSTKIQASFRLQVTQLPERVTYLTSVSTIATSTHCYPELFGV